MPAGDLVRRMGPLLRPYWRQIALAMVLLGAGVLAGLLPWFLWKYLIDDVLLAGRSGTTPAVAWVVSLGGTFTGPVTLLMLALGWLLAATVLGELLQAGKVYVLQSAAQDFVRVLRNRVYDKLQRRSLAFIHRQKTGELMTRVLGDVGKLQNLGISGVDKIFGDLVSWAAVVVMALLIDWRVTLASLVPLAGVYLLMRWHNHHIKPIYEEVRRREGEIGSRLFENLSGLSVIKMFGRERAEADRFAATTVAYHEKQLEAMRQNNLFRPIKRMVSSLSTILMVAVAGYLILERPQSGFTVGDLVMFRAFWGRLLGPMGLMTDVNDILQRTRVSASRVFDVLEAPDDLPEAPDAAAITGVRDGFELRGVRFAYPPTPGASRPNAPALDGVDLTIPAGMMTALVGPSGAGKSTVFNLLLRHYDPDEGRVLLDGRDLRAVARDSFRRHVGVVAQETFLFNDSVLDNIRYARPEAGEAEVMAAADAAEAHDFIRGLPDGYATPVGERGVRLSGGQRQRIAIARAFLLNPSVLLLDEPTSSVEPDCEAAIAAALERLAAGRTTVLTSHRPALVMRADEVRVLEGGRVVAAGTPTLLGGSEGWFGRFAGGNVASAGRREKFSVSSLDRHR